MGGFIFGTGATGQAGIYAQIVSRNTGLYANGASMESYNQAHWGNYSISTPENAGSGKYVLSIPGYLPAGEYEATFYAPLGGSPASGDTPFSTYLFQWNGTNLISVASSLDVGSINGSATAAVNLSLSANAFAVGAAAAGTLTTTRMSTNLTGTVANMYAGRTLYFTSGANAGIAVLITAYAVTGGILTFIAYNNAALPVAPSAADSFIII